MRDTKYQKFDIRPVLERLLLKGSIVVKKAYCDWERYKEFKAPMHEANFELIEIPHVRQSGKNSADIRLVVDALDFCYTKSHVNTFVIISGDSDFSPLVSKLRENNKKVIGVGVKQSTSDLLIANCDEFIFYDDLAREGQRAADARRDNRGGNAGQRRSPDEERRRKEELEARKTQAVDMVVETFEALMAERGDSGKVWASALKDALKRRRPDFNESYYGFRAFGNLLDEAQSRGFLDVGREEKSGTYVYRDSAGGTPARVGGKPALRAMAAAVEAPERGRCGPGFPGRRGRCQARPRRARRPQECVGRPRRPPGRGPGVGPSGRARGPRRGQTDGARGSRGLAATRPAGRGRDRIGGAAGGACPGPAPAPAPAPELAALPVTDDHPSSTEAPAEPKSRRGAPGRGAAKTARAAKAPAPQASHADGAAGRPPAPRPRRGTRRPPTLEPRAMRPPMAPRPTPRRPSRRARPPRAHAVRARPPTPSKPARGHGPAPCRRPFNPPPDPGRRSGRA
ncbi:NYN domain-containing protein [Achromobacter insuavis]